MVFDHFLSSGLTQRYLQILSRVDPPGETTSNVDISPRVFPTRSSPSKPRAPRRLKKKVKQDPPQVVFSMGDDEDPEDLEEGSIQQRRSTRKPSQAAAQVFFIHTFSSSEVSFCEF